MTSLIAITGATGFIGRHVLSEFQKRGIGARALVRDAGQAASLGSHEMVRGSLSDGPSLRRLIAGADAIVHLAGAIEAPDRAGYFVVNEAGTRALAQVATAAGARRLVHLSSLSARAPHLSDYGASKLAGETALTGLPPSLRIAILRPPAVYGPGDRATLPLFAQLTRKLALIPGAARARFSLIHAADLARIVADAALGDWTGIRECDDGNPGGYSWRDLVAIAATAEDLNVSPVFIPRPVPMAAAHGLTLWRRLSGRGSLVSPGKIAELYHPDWVARDALTAAEPIGFAEGFRETVAWYRAEGWLPARRGADRRPRRAIGDAGG